MATTVTKWTCLIILINTLILITAQQQSPCLFFFGDSQFDNGNNNNLITLAKVNYPPYGIDYPSGPTGRFSNGKNIPDFLATLLGFSGPIPPYVSTTGSDILRGVNYASGASGILESSGARVGQQFSMDTQVQFHEQTAGRIAGLLRSRTAANQLLRRCLYVVNMGSNDYINNYYNQPPSFTQLLYTPDTFAQHLIRVFSRQLRRLYSIGSRKVAVFGLGLIGCVPQELAIYPTNGASPCVDFINNAVGLFNNLLFSLITALNNELPGARFTYINATSIALTDLSSVGIRVLNASCCPVDASTGLCIRNGIPCSNRSEYAFYDNFHTTEKLNEGTASRAYTVQLPTDASPVDIRTLAQQ